MLPPPLLVAAISASLLLTSCASALSGPEGSPAPSTESEAESPTTTTSQFPPCEGVTLDELQIIFTGDYRESPPDGVYPAYLPLPSCVFEESDQIVSIFIKATRADFDALKAAVVVEQGAGVNADVDAQIPGQEWPGDRVSYMSLVPPGYGTAVQYIQLGSTHSP